MAGQPPPLALRLRRALRAITLDVSNGWFHIGRHRTEADGHGEFRRELKRALYWYLHAGTEDEALPAGKPQSDPALEKALREAVPHTHTQVTVRIIDSRAPGLCIADIGGVRVRLPERPGVISEDRARFAMECVRPRLSPGFLLVDGSLGHGLTTEPTLRVYTRIGDVSSAAPVWGRALAILEEFGVPYRAKIACTRPFHSRRDAMVVYLGPAAQGIVEPFAHRIADHDGVSGAVSMFVRQLRPGVGVAWEPRQLSPRYAGHSFGEHRAAVVADALMNLGHAQGARRELAVADALTEAGIDPTRPWESLEPAKGDPFKTV
jgi:hypothetical protein